jgi:tetratricopeptide (TPR) repeat protein
MALPFVTNVALFQPHRGYQAAVGLAIATAAVAAELAQRALAATRSDSGRRTIRIAGSVAGAAVVVAMVVGDARAGRAWRDEVGFWAEAVAQYPNEASYHHSLGAARLRAGDPSGAVEALTAAARLDPVLPRVDFNLGLAYTKLGQYHEAIAAYERAVALDPADVKSLANVGWLYEWRGETASAARFYRAALAVNPGLGAVRERLARLDGLAIGTTRSGALPTVEP